MKDIIIVIVSVIGLTFLLLILPLILTTHFDMTHILGPSAIRMIELGGFVINNPDVVFERIMMVFVAAIGQLSILPIIILIMRR